MIAFETALGSATEWRGVCVVFFFSSRRRHTRLQGDWSSDVCSSDLTDEGVLGRTLNAVSVAEKSDVQRAPKDSLVCSEPLESFFRGNGQRLVRDRALDRKSVV